MSDQVRKVRIATRQSQLALWQAEHVSSSLLGLNANIEVELVKMITQGDKILDTPLAKIGGKGLFVKELEIGLLEKKADLAVHSMKDVPVELPQGLEISAVLKREDPRDAFVSNEFNAIEDLPKNAVVGTSSLRRQSQLKKLRPDLEIKSLRGNVNTRLSKLDQGDYQAIILASAGLIRLGMEERIRAYIEPSEILPAIGQGAIGIETRSGDYFINELVAQLHDKNTAICLSAERAFNETLQGGCQVPIGAYAQLEDGLLYMRGLVAEPDGSLILFCEDKGPVDKAVEMGVALANELLSQGADKILKALYNET